MLCWKVELSFLIVRSLISALARSRQGWLRIQIVFSLFILLLVKIPEILSKFDSKIIMICRLN